MILVTGGTGLVGSHLLYFLLKETQQIRVLHRKSSEIESVKNIFKIYTSAEQAENLFNQIEWFEADITDLPELEKAFIGITHVYHCAAYVSFNPSDYTKLKKINVEGTANIMNLCIDFGIKKCCFVSTIATLSKKPEQLLTDESSNWNQNEKNSDYALTKYGAEMEAWRATQEGLDVVIVNPGIILGISPNREESSIISSLKNSKNIPFYTTGGNGFVDVRDVVRIMLELMKLSIKNERFILVGENTDYKTFLTKFATAFNKKFPKKKINPLVLNALNSFEWLFHKLFRSRRKLSKDLIRSLFATREYDNSKIVNLLDYQFISLEETFRYLATKNPDNQD